MLFLFGKSRAGVALYCSKDTGLSDPSGILGLESKKCKTMLKIKKTVIINCVTM